MSKNFTALAALKLRDEGKLRFDEPAETVIPELKGKFDTAITALKADGTLDTLIAKWFEGRGPYFAE